MSWRYLQPGDIVDVVAPGYPTGKEEIARAKKFLEDWNLVPRLPKNIMKPHFLHAHEDEMRFKLLSEALNAPDSKVVWCLRGGYGSNRLLPYLDQLKKPSTTKLLVGISDITSLHVYLNQKWGWSSLHGPLLDRLGAGLVPESIVKETKNIVFGGVESSTIKGLKALNKAARQVKALESKITGGNLTVLQSQLGTPYQVKTDHRLLFLEDLGERGYRIDRMLEQFKQAGLFAACDGILLGHFIGGVEPSTGKNNFDKVFKRFAEENEIPVWSGVPAGHDVEQRPLFLNTDVRLESRGEKYDLFITNGVNK